MIRLITVFSYFGLYPGALVVPCGCGGSFLGGYLIKKFQMKTASILKFSMLLVLSSLVFSLAFLVLVVYFLLSIDSWLTNFE